MFKTELERNMMDSIYRAKLLIESRHPEEDEREWSYTATIDSKGIDSRVEMYVLDVKQPVGYIIASYAAKKVKALDWNLSSLITYTIKEGDL